MARIFRQSYVWALAAIVGLGLYFAANVASETSTGRLIVWAVAAVVTVALVGIGTYRLARQTGWPITLNLTAPPVFMTVSAFLYILLAETAMTRYAIGLVAVLLSLIYLDNLRTAASRSEAERDDLAHLAHLIDLVGFFFLSGFLFGFRFFYYVPTLLLGFIVGGMVVHVVTGDFRRFGIDPRRNALPMIWFLVLGWQAFTVLAYLPVSHLVDAAVLVVLVAGSTQITRNVLLGTAATDAFRREMLLTFGLSAILLATAAWI